MASSSAPPQDVDDHKALTDNAAFMDKYSRQIGAFGMEAMSKLIQLKVRVCVCESIHEWKGGPV